MKVIFILVSRIRSNHLLKCEVSLSTRVKRSLKMNAVVAGLALAVSLRCNNTPI